MPDSLGSLHRLAALMGVATRFTDGLGREVAVSPDSLLQICAALGAPVGQVDDAGEAVRERLAVADRDLVPTVIVAWDGRPVEIPVAGADQRVRAELTLEDGTVLAVSTTSSTVHLAAELPPGYHRLDVEAGDRTATATVIAAPEHSWQGNVGHAGWGVSAQLAALRSGRSRSVGDLADLTTLCDWVGASGGDLVTLLPLLPTFNDPPTEPSPYSPVSRLFWSELMLDLGDRHRPVSDVGLLQTERAAAEVRTALASVLAPDPASVDGELARYAQFRAAQSRLGRDWGRWNEAARGGRFRPGDLDTEEERFHLVAQIEARRQLATTRGRLDEFGVRLGLDLTVGVHPDGYDVWSRPGLFAAGISVGAPPDEGFPSGQSWGFPPVLPDASRREGHHYLAACIAHQASAADLLRIDHVMAMSRLYWIPEGMDLDQGTYVGYPCEELFAVLCLESHRNRCVLVGEDLGTVPPEIEEALPRHRILGMYLAEFEAGSGRRLEAPAAAQAAMIDTHDTPTFAGWVAAVDVDERVRLGLLDAADGPEEHDARRRAVQALARHLGGEADDPADLLDRLLDWLGRSPSPVVSIWLEDLWLEPDPVNIPGSGSAERPNWRRPIRERLEVVLDDPGVIGRADVLDRARRSMSEPGRESSPNSIDY